MTWTLAGPMSTNFLQVYFLFVKPPGMISSLHECLRRIRPLQQGMLRRTCNSNRPSHAVAQGGARPTGLALAPELVRAIVQAVRGAESFQAIVGLHPRPKAFDYIYR